MNSCPAECSEQRHFGWGAIFSYSKIRLFAWCRQHRPKSVRDKTFEVLPFNKFEESPRKKKGRTKRRDRHENKIFYTAALPRIIYDGLCFTEWRVGVERTSLGNLKPFLNNHSILDTRSLIPESKKENKGRVFRIKNLATICRMSSNIGSFSLRYFDLEVSTRWKALDEIYKIQLFLHRSDQKIQQHSSNLFLPVQKWF